MYTFIIFIHVISAILSIGPFFVLFPLLNRMKGKSEEMLDTALEVFQAAIRLVKHAGHVLSWIGYSACMAGELVMDYFVGHYDNCSDGKFDCISC